MVKEDHDIHNSCMQGNIMKTYINPNVLELLPATKNIKKVNQNKTCEL